VFWEKRLQTIENKGSERGKEHKETTKRLQADANMIFCAEKWGRLSGIPELPSCPYPHDQDAYNDCGVINGSKVQGPNCDKSNGQDDIPDNVAY
jgi:hypothetical protein